MTIAVVALIYGSFPQPCENEALTYTGTGHAHAYLHKAMKDLIEYIRLLLCADSAILQPWIVGGIAVFLVMLLLFVGWVRLWNKVWWIENLRLIVVWGGAMALLCAATGMVKDVSQDLQKDKNARLLLAQRLLKLLLKSWKM